MKQTTISVVDTLTKDAVYTVGSGEHKVIFLLCVDGASMEGSVTVDIVGSDAYAQILGIIIAKNKQVVRIHTTQHHGTSSSTSDLLIRGIVSDHARSYYTGTIVIDAGAQKSNAYQKNQHLLLSKTAWADSRPMLEILANDVRCTHGATIGTIDDEQVYYLASRGISRKDATRIMVEGYLQEVWDRLPDEQVRDDISSRVRIALDSLT